jgi:hypothetical protein
MRVALLIGTLASLTGVGGFAAGLSQAIQLQDGTVYFAQPPRLVEAVTTLNSINVWGATYYFTVRLPDNAGEPLQKVTIYQQEGGEYVRFDLKGSFAFQGTRPNQGQRLTIQDVTSDRETQSVSITFAGAVKPGKTVTIALKPIQNPNTAGVYLFGVKAFPTGDKSHGQFLGFGRLHFYSDGIDSFIYPWQNQELHADDAISL